MSVRSCMDGLFGNRIEDSWICILRFELLVAAEPGIHQSSGRKNDRTLQGTDGCRCSSNARCGAIAVMADKSEGASERGKLVAVRKSIDTGRPNVHPS